MDAEAGQAGVQRKQENASAKKALLRHVDIHPQAAFARKKTNILNKFFRPHEPFPKPAVFNASKACFKTKTLLLFWFGIVCFVISFQSFASAQQSIRVVDGDTIEINDITYRLFGIDAPEAGQTCANGSGSRWKCGKAAIEALEELVLGQDVTCDNRGMDDYERVISVCKANGVDLNAQMVTQGLAWAFVKYANDYLPEEQSARRSSLGVFVAATETPWDYRAKRWAVAEQVAPKGCPIKGNISDSGKIYHMPWSPWYDRTGIKTANGERWFCNETEAKAAGWRAPYWGRS